MFLAFLGTPPLLLVAIYRPHRLATATMPSRVCLMPLHMFFFGACSACMLIPERDQARVSTARQRRRAMHHFGSPKLIVDIGIVDFCRQSVSI
jgi:hypothetical protein